MDIENVKLALTALGALAAIATPLLGSPLARKTLAEVRHLERGRRRTESDFAFKLAEATGDAVIKRYAEELGYAALTGDRHLTHEQRKCLLSLPDAERDIETYMRTRKLVMVVDDERHFAWKRPRYEQARYRLLVRVGWLIPYLACCALAASPWLVWQFALHGPWSSTLGALQAYMFLLFAPPAVMCVRAGSLVNESEQFIKDIRKRKVNALGISRPDEALPFPGSPHSADSAPEAARATAQTRSPAEV